MRNDKKYLVIFITLSIILMILGFYLLNYKEFHTMTYTTPFATYPYYSIGTIMSFISLFLLIGTILGFILYVIMYNRNAKKFNK